MQSRSTKSTLSGIACLGLLMSSAGLASAASMVYPGSACQAQTATDDAKVGHNPWGTYNSSTTATAQVICLIPTPPGAAVTSLSVKAFDRNGSGNVTCSLDAMDSVGNPFFYQSKGTTVNSNSVTPLSFVYTTLPTAAWGVMLDCTIFPQTASGVSAIASIHVTTSP